MTQPAIRPTTAVDRSIIGTPPKPKMTDEELRLECVRLAVQANALRSELVGLAGDIENFVKGGRA